MAEQLPDAELTAFVCTRGRPRRFADHAVTQKPPAPASTGESWWVGKDRRRFADEQREREKELRQQRRPGQSVPAAPPTRGLG